MRDDWTSFPFTYDGVTRDVYTLPSAADDTRRGIVLLHELGGISKATQDLAEELERSHGDHPGFRVFLPAMFGNPKQRTGLSGLLAGPLQMMCMRAEFRAMQSTSSSPIAGYMRALCREVSEITGDKVGLIGMCLTGGVVFSMVWEPAVGAVVSGQPSLPFKVDESAVTVSEEDLKRSAQYSTRQSDQGTVVEKRIQLHYFNNDKLCNPKRVAALEAKWNTLTGSANPIDTHQHASSGGDHATLTEDFEKTVQGDRTSRDTVRDFFETEL